jgi:hypothetical protein
MLKLWEFYCEECDREWEDLTDDETSICEQCNTKTERQKICSGKFGAWSVMDEDGRRQSLLRRSAEHTAKELRKEPEKFGPEGVRRSREDQVRSFGGFKKD